MEIASLVISHKKASINEIQKAWHGDYKSLIDKVLSFPNIYECAILLTCNRVEVYVVGKKTVETLKEFACKMRVPERIIEIHKNDDCLEHILRVSAGLESMMIGEDQILGQVKDFYNLSKMYGGIGEVLDIVFNKAIQVGKKVRRETKINRGSVSIGSAAVELAEKILGSLRGKKVLIIGAGEMSRLVAKSLAHKGCATLYLANRTMKRGERLAKEVNGIAVRFDKIERYMVESDIVFSATSSQNPIITCDAVKRVMEVKKDKLIIIDIALPRDVEEEVENIENVEVYTIDDLREISYENLKKRIKEAKKAEKIVADELKHLKDMLKELRANNILAIMYSHAESVKRYELEELYNKLKAKYDIDESVISLLEDFANSFIKKFLRKPTVKLKMAARNGMNEVIDAIEFLFGGEEFGIPKAKDEKIEKRQDETAIQANES